ncbi:MAG: ABC transporter permease [Deltaproteobacteria bacterium]|nr:ABC transporter permease [Deltaproteobacteria bacterium]MBI3294788.1 ABC transporter permease [Deltaproteobacteria bacterium]
MNFTPRNPIAECFQYREVLRNIISQDLKVKYRRTLLGYVWSLLNPVLQLVVLSLVFSHLVGRFGVENYTLFLFSGLIAWIFFQQSLTMSAISLLQNENFIKKVYLPKVIFPLSKLCLRGIDFLFSLLALSLIGLIFGFTLKWTFALVPAAALILFVFTLGLALLVSVATVYFRDVEYFLSLFLQLFYFLTPILYPISVLPEQYRPWVALNPLYSHIQLFQKLIYFGVVPSPVEWGLAALWAVVSFAVGYSVMVLFEDDLVFMM